MKYDEKIQNRMKRIEGQVRGVMKMMEEEKDCRDVVTQMTAIRSAIDRTSALIVSQNLEECIREEMENDGDNKRSSEDLVKEAVNLLVKSR
jgi:DNA-binding FrmR family transcriptional regulator